MLSGNQHISLLITQPHACSYLPDRSARNLVVDPRLRLDGPRYEALLTQGFRRSGDAVYRPHCAQCQACTPVRVPVVDFLPNRAQRRCIRRNADLELVRTRTINRGILHLYERYLRARHEGEGMDADDHLGFERFTACNWLTVEYWQFFAGIRLIACAVVDVLPNGYSAVYTVFDPDPQIARRSLGTYAVLRQIEEARADGRRHVWLGYWIPGCGKMEYKKCFLPQERGSGDDWKRIAVDGPRD